MASQKELADELLRLARDDEAAVRAMLSEPAVSNAIVCFHAQQAVEKALKAVLASRGVVFPFTHDLDGLVELCKDVKLTVPTELDGVDRLTPYGVRVRYGGGDPGTVDRATALRWAGATVEWAAARIDVGSTG